MDHSDTELEVLEKIKNEIATQFGVDNITIEEFYRKFTFLFSLPSGERHIAKSLIRSVNEDKTLEIPGFNRLAYPRIIANFKFLNKYTPSLVPKLYGVLKDYYLIILEKLEGKGIDEYIHANPESSEMAGELLSDFMEALGHLHGKTHGKLQEYITYLQKEGDNKLLKAPYWILIPPAEDGSSLLVETLENVNTHLELDLPKAFFEAVEQLLIEVYQCDLTSFVHGDPCPDNILVTDQGLKFIDLDISNFFCPLLDATYRDILFPTCWCVGKVPKPILEKMKTRYLQTYNKYNDLDEQTYSYWAGRISLLWVLWDITRFLRKRDDVTFEDLKTNEWGTATVLDRYGTRFKLIQQFRDQLQPYNIILDAFPRISEQISLKIGPLGEIPIYKAFKDT